MNEKFLSEMNREYREFLNEESVNPPVSLSESILDRVRRDLNPSAWLVFAKLALAHLLSGMVTLSLCPQFGVRILGEGMGLMKVFMAFGNYGCMAACGAFFVGATVIVAAAILNRDELRKLRRYWFLQLAALVFLSLGVLLMSNAEVLLGYGLAWIAGSMAGGLAMLELGWFVRRHGFSAA